MGDDEYKIEYLRDNKNDDNESRSVYSALQSQISLSSYGFLCSSSKFKSFSRKIYNESCYHIEVDCSSESVSDKDGSFFYKQEESKILSDKKGKPNSRPKSIKTKVHLSKSFKIEKNTAPVKEIKSKVLNSQKDESSLTPSVRRMPSNRLNFHKEGWQNVAANSNTVDNNLNQKSSSAFKNQKHLGMSGKRKTQVKQFDLGKPCGPTIEFSWPCGREAEIKQLQNITQDLENSNRACFFKRT